MSNTSVMDQLNDAIESFIAGADGNLMAGPEDEESNKEARDLFATAREFRYIARPEFKTRLRSELQWKAAAKAASTHEPGAALDNTDVLPTLFGKGYGAFPVHGRNFVASMMLHAAALALVIGSGLWVAQHRDEVKHEIMSTLIDPGEYALPPAPTEAGGGGGGGDRDKIAASKGSAPRFDRQQITPPMVVLRNSQPKLPVEPTLVGPPSLVFPHTSQTGDPMGAILTASNGPGFGGGIGNGTGGGIGSGSGPGLGPGYGGGIGGGIYRVGGGVSAPRAIFEPDPEYSEEARRAKYQGSVVLWVVIGPDGRPRDIRVQRSLGMGLDEKAIEAVRKWRFDPAKKDGRPVAVQVNIEVNFRLY